MNQRDQELLDKQLRGFSRSPPRNGGIMGVGFIAVFLVGIAIGDVLFARTSKRIQTASHDVTAALFLPNDVPLATGQ
ncbi:MAG: hypothetical protein WBE94_14780 [Pseudolabrys sp.]|jgi:hypothetical protein